MFKVGDLIIYSVHGICKIDNICEKAILGKIKEYYELHPVGDNKLRISIPVDNDKVVMLEILGEEEAEEILESFSSEGIEWIEYRNDRIKSYGDIVKTGNIKEIARILNTLIRKKRDDQVSGERVNDQDKRLLNSIESILYTELAFSLNIDYETISKKVIKLISENKVIEIR